MERGGELVDTANQISAIGIQVDKATKLHQWALNTASIRPPTPAILGDEVKRLRAKKAEIKQTVGGSTEPTSS